MVDYTWFAALTVKGQNAPSLPEPALSLHDLFGQQTEVEITRGEYGAGLKRLCTLQLTLLFSPKELVFGLPDDDRDKAPSPCWPTQSQPTPSRRNARQRRS